jgi:hypothetical protein
VRTNTATLLVCLGTAAGFVAGLLAAPPPPRVEDAPAFRAMLDNYHALEADNRELRLQVASLRGTGEARP